MIWNRAASNLLGYTADEALGTPILQVLPPDFHSRFQAAIANTQTAEASTRLETVALAKNAHRIEVSIDVVPVIDPRRGPIGCVLAIEDLGNRRHNEKERARLAAIVDSSEDAIIAKNMDSIITDWNSAAEKLLGYSAEEIVGQSVLRIIPPELHFEEPGIIGRLRRGERIEHYETRRLRKDGSLIDVALTVSPILDAHGRVIGGSKILRDIRDRKTAEAALVEKERFLAAGRLAATLAHEVNNPLESITNLAYLLSRNSSLDAEARSYAELLLREVQRAGEITRQTLSYYRQSKLPGDIDLEQVIEHVFKGKHKKLSEKSINFDISFVDVPHIQGFAGEIRQVFDNLIENAIDAVPSNGRVSVHGRREGKNTVVSVRDNGLGIPAETASKIFEPFFTTKLDKGSGLGLWVTRAIVEKHGGKITVESQQGNEHHETIFTVELPVEAVSREAAAGSGLVQSANQSLRRV